MFLLTGRSIVGAQVDIEPKWALEGMANVAKLPAQNLIIWNVQILEQMRKQGWQYFVFGNSDKALALVGVLQQHGHEIEGLVKDESARITGGLRLFSVDEFKDKFHPNQLLLVPEFDAVNVFHSFGTDIAISIGFCHHLL